MEEITSLHLGQWWKRYMRHQTLAQVGVHLASLLLMAID